MLRSLIPPPRLRLSEWIEHEIILPEGTSALPGRVRLWPYQRAIADGNDLASKIQDRIPVLLQPKDFDRWLAGAAGTELLKPAANDYLQAWPVSRRVNSSRAPGNDPTLIEQIAA